MGLLQRCSVDPDDRVRTTVGSSAGAVHGGDASSVPDGLRCEHLVNPLGIDDVQPRLSWRLEPVRPHGSRAAADRVSDSGGESAGRCWKRTRADRWDTGRVASDQSIHVPYQGQPLASRSECWWKVRIWDEQNSASAWSEPALWSMGLLTRGGLVRCPVDRLR